MIHTIALPDGTSREPTPDDLLEIARLQKLAEEEAFISIKNAVRAERTRLLLLCDWTQFADIPQETKDKWVNYRQALRDVPQQAGFPWKIDWPTQPE